MGFNYAKEKNKFEANWKKLQRRYEDAGMPPEAIDAMHTYDWEAFLAHRIHSSHTQALPVCLSESTEDDRSTLFQKYPSLFVSFDIDDFSERYSWVETISNDHLTAKLKSLPSEDLELLTFLIIEEHDQEELARRWGCSQSAISQRFKKLKELLKVCTYKVKREFAENQRKIRW